MTNNMKDNDPVNIGDIKSKIKDLPDNPTIIVNMEELPLSNDTELEQYLFDKLGKKYAMKVNNAKIAEVNKVVLK